MNPISNFFEKFKKLILGSEFQNKVIVDAIKNNAGVDIDSSQIKVQGNTLHIQISPAIKLHILLKKEKILEDIRKEANNSPIKEIR